VEALHAEQKKAGHSLSIPLFLKVSPTYLVASPRVVFVGQETHGWWTDFPRETDTLTAGEIMNFYETVWTELFDKYKRSTYSGHAACEYLGWRPSL
jgi:hypothetical protein